MRTRNLCAILIIAMVCVSLSASILPGKKKKAPEDLRKEYLAKLQLETAAGDQERTVGSLWTPNGSLVNLITDYKASKLGDAVVINVVASTAASASGNATSEHTTSHSSAITGLGAHLSTGGVNPIIDAGSTSKLKGTGQSDSSSSLRSTLSGVVIAVLPNGNLVVEAQRMLQLNNDKETMIVRGVVRPGDISSSNVITSTSLMNLEVELRGKGIISDATRPFNPIARAVMWLVGF